MTIEHLAALAIAGFAGSWAGSQDQAPVGSRIRRPEQTEPVEQNDASKVQKRFVECVYERRPAQVDAILAASDTHTIDYEAAGIPLRRISAVLDMESCLSRATSVTDTDLRLSVQLPSLRAMMLEHSYRVRNPSGPTWMRVPALKPARRFFSVGDKLVQAQVAAKFADCVVELAPRESDILIRAAAGSAAETAAIRSLIPHLSSCIGEGVQISLKPEQLRAFLADGLWTAWRASAAPRPAPAGVK